MTHIAPEKIEASLPYEAYRDLLTRLLAEGKTTGHHQSPAMLEYARLNQQRMDRLDKTFRLDPEAAEQLRHIDRPLLWLTLTEGWCGDAAQIVPVLHALSKANPNVTLRLLLRDEHPDLMDAFLTNGSRSIPKVIFVDPTDRRVLGSWGPRPEAAQALMMQAKADMEAIPDPEARKARYHQAAEALHTWYARDKTIHIQREIALSPDKVVSPKSSVRSPDKG